ncbi:MAG: hypothetical protein ABH854_01640 [Candidatus Diapherotrites archaeon]|nr:hypothetical protein [Candidatus Micrarchaeota archaeon]MBU1939253.1 hypothetical protein [Candidatus Micrarchaeota archaeon]
MDEKVLSDSDVVSALEGLLERQQVTDVSKTPSTLTAELAVVLNAIKSGQKVDAQYKQTILGKAESVVSNIWFKECSARSPKLSAFYSGYRALKGA